MQYVIKDTLLRAAYFEFYKGRPNPLLGWVTVCAGGSKPPRFVTSYSGQLSLLPSAGRKMSKLTDQSALTWEVKARQVWFFQLVDKCVGGR